MSLDKKNYITGKQKRQALFLNFLNFFINIYKIPNSTICQGGGSETSLAFENNDPQLIMQARLHCLVLAAVQKAYLLYRINSLTPSPFYTQIIANWQ